VGEPLVSRLELSRDGRQDFLNASRSPAFVTTQRVPFVGESLATWLDGYHVKASLREMADHDGSDRRDP